MRIAEISQEKKTEKAISSMAISSLSFVISLFLLSLFLSFSSSSSSSSTPLSHVLRTRGYNHFASIIDKVAVANAGNWNATGTLFAPTDSAFISKMFRNGAGGPTLLSPSLLPYHTARLLLRFQDLTSMQDGVAFPTFYPGYCLYLCRSLTGELCVANRKKPLFGHVTIWQPNLYTDGKLIVHGIDGILDHSDASTCAESDVFTRRNPTEAEAFAPTPAADSHLEHAARALGQRGYGVVAAALKMWRPMLLLLDASTVFAPSDEDLLTSVDGFHFNFRRHVLPHRFLYHDLAILPNGTVIDTMATPEAVVVGAFDGLVTINGVVVKPLEIYQNQRIVVLSIPRPLPVSFVAPVNQDSNPAMRSPAGASDSGEIHNRSVPSPTTTKTDDGAWVRNAHGDLSSAPAMVVAGEISSPSPSPSPSPHPSQSPPPNSVGFAGATPPSSTNSSRIAGKSPSPSPNSGGLAENSISISTPPYPLWSGYANRTKKEASPSPAPAPALTPMNRDRSVLTPSPEHPSGADVVAVCHQPAGVHDARIHVAAPSSAT